VRAGKPTLRAGRDLQERSAGGQHGLPQCRIDVVDLAQQGGKDDACMVAQGGGR